MSTATIQSVHSNEVLLLMAVGGTFVDVRSDEEHSDKSEPMGSVWIPYAPKALHNPTPVELTAFRRQVLQHVATDKIVILICKVGVRSRLAGEALLQGGFTRVLHVTGGLEGNVEDPGWITWGNPLRPTVSR